MRRVGEKPGVIRDVTRRGGGVGEPDPEDPHFVHDEIRVLAAKTKEAVKQNFKRHGTNQDEILFGLREFGVSEQSKTMLGREEGAAQLAAETGIYVVFRNEYATKTSRDFCTRVGPAHRCFCGHSLERHMEKLGRPARGGLVRPPPCAEAGCGCSAYRYIPNEPEEIGEAWITRRKDFLPGSWNAKCRCGHAHVNHDASGKSGSMKCKSCARCYNFESHFLCVVCDQKWEAHETVFETEQTRAAAGLPVRLDFFPLKDVDPALRELVFGSPPAEPAPKALPPSSNSTTATLPMVENRARSLHHEQERFRGHQTQSSVSADNTLPPFCEKCATVFRNEGSKFCPKCGTPRK